MGHLVPLVLIISTLSGLSLGLGGPVKVDAENLSAEQKNVVDFAVVQLQGLEEGKGECGKRLLRVENFSQQVVAGLRYKFDLVLGTEAGCEEAEEKRCEMDVYSVPWQQEMSIQWENVRCDTGEEVTTKANRIRLSVPLIKYLPQVRVGIVDLTGKEFLDSDIDKIPLKKPLLGSDDHDKVPHGKPLLGSDDHDKVPHGKPLLGSDDHDKVPHGLIMGGSAHGPMFDDSYTVKELKSEATSQEELKQLQSLGAFHEFLRSSGKEYKDREEYKFRYGVYKDNMKKVQFLSETEQGTATYGATVFADLTEAEFKQQLGLTPVWKSRRMNEDPIHWPPADIPDIELPKEFDWRAQNAVTEVKNQGQCGSCWAFSVTGNVEGQYAVKHGQLLDLSEQELVDCDTRDNGCGGGLPENAYKTLLEIGGLETEADYGYDGKDEACKFNRSRVAAKVSGGVEIGQNETQMAQWLLKNGPISVGLNANAMQFYKGGVSHPFQFLCNPEGVDHGVLIVGFGEHDYPLFKKKMPYWIIKNSWGTGWGESGYYRLFRGDGSCGINTLTSSATVE